MPEPLVARAAPPSGAAAPRARRSGARSRRAAPAPPRGPARRSVMCAWSGCIHSSQPARSAIGRAWPQWSECAWVKTSRRTCSSRRPTCSSARSRCASEPGSCIPRVDQHDPVARRRAPRRCSAGRPATAAAGAAARRRGRRARRGRPRVLSGGLAHEVGRYVNDGRECRGHDASRPSSTDLLRGARAPRPRRHGGLLGARRRWTTSSAQVDAVGPDGVRAYFGELFAAIPDFALMVRRDRGRGRPVAVRWRATGTFAGPAAFQGIEPTGARIELEGIDVLRVETARSSATTPYVDGDGVGAPDRAAAASRLDRRAAHARAFNARTRSHAPRRRARARAGRRRRLARARRLPAQDVQRLLIEDDGDGVTMFDAGIRAMANALAAAGAPLGGINARRARPRPRRPPRRGARACGVPVYCHPADAADAEGDGGVHYFDFSPSCAAPARWAIPRAAADVWDGGPGADRGHGRGGRRGRGLPRRPPPGPRARA